MIHPSSNSTPYIGRFAPTPTGPLHFGSLIAALASYLDAKAHDGKWLLRIEDLDPPREDPAASERMPHQLLDHGLQWDGDIQYQSQHSANYEAALKQLAANKRTFACGCSRKQLSVHNGLHQGDCHFNQQGPAAIRLAVPDESIGVQDRIYGHYEQNLLNDVGDQVLKRKDGFYAYQLAVVVDDYLSGINHVVRGVDLLDNTPRQIFLMQCLGYPVPSYLHIPLAINEHGQKLSKQNQATAIESQDAKANILKALSFLQQDISSTMSNSSLRDILQMACQNWQPSRIQPNQAGLL
ncbi:MAG: tRNA glutamyl-Q(34) synthetase GluQRS [Gammaproteobacteria bacterium]|nr:tRNA glutamyl-Q(34) synthetase GluQRS [Gammaproteobacteria bacterium]